MLFIGGLDTPGARGIWGRGAQETRAQGGRGARRIFLRQSPIGTPVSSLSVFGKGEEIVLGVSGVAGLHRRLGHSGVSGAITPWATLIYPSFSWPIPIIQPSPTLFYLDVNRRLGSFSKKLYEDGLFGGCVSVKTQEGWIGDAQGVTSNLGVFLVGTVSLVWPYILYHTQKPTRDSRRSFDDCFKIFCRSSSVHLALPGVEAKATVEQNKSDNTCIAESGSRKGGYGA